MVGAALFREEDDIPLLDLLYVLPGECRNLEATEGKLDSLPVFWIPAIHAGMTA